jgi:hypothetical protein
MSEERPGYGIDLDPFGGDDELADTLVVLRGVHVAATVCAKSIGAWAVRYDDAGHGLGGAPGARLASKALDDLRSFLGPVKAALVLDPFALVGQIPPGVDPARALPQFV